jgi:hypothetical protein
MMTGSSIARNLAQNATGAAPREAACHAQFLGANLPQGEAKGET